MAGNLRRERLSQGVGAKGAVGGQWSFRPKKRLHFFNISRLQILFCLLFTIIIMLPIGWGVTPLPYYLGHIAERDIVSRVNFSWIDKEKERNSIREIETSYERRYAEVEHYDWSSQVINPLQYIFEQAARKDDPAALIATAKSKGVELTPEQAKTIVGELQNKILRLNANIDIISPLREILYDIVYRRGVMDGKRFNEERGRIIKVVGDFGDVRRVRVTGGQQSPVEKRQLREIFDESINRKMSSSLSLKFRAVLRDLLVQSTEPTIRYDAALSGKELQDLISQVRNQVNEIVEGEVLLAKGDAVTPEVLRKLREEQTVFRSRSSWRRQAFGFAGKGLLIFFVALGFAIYFPSAGMDLNLKRNPIIGLAVVAVAVAYTAHLVIYAGLPETLVPLGLLAGLAGLLAGPQMAMLAVTACGVLLLILFEGRSGPVVALMTGGWLFSLTIRSFRHKLGLVGMSLLCGLLTGGISLLWALAVREDIASTISLQQIFGLKIEGTPLHGAMVAVANWLCTGFLLLFAIRSVERIFGATTNITLQELQDQEQSILRQLVIEAPGTYHHSVIVGTLAEAGAEAVGANQLLARVGAYYHDIGKLMKPEYFSENESGMSRHDSLNPSMSTLIIIGHVKDGVEMAEQYGLPKAIVDIVAQHHGTGSVSYFLHKARKQAGPDQKVAEAPFRYPGPIPQSKEAALVMLADSVEAASRAMDHPTPAYIRRRVRELFSARLQDGQLDNSGLTLTDLLSIENSFVRILNSMFHSRVKYPGQEKDAKGRKAR